ncbi:31805_t:CDS:2, partial [Gigaspora margarita]
YTDPALVATICNEFPTTDALYCMFHIVQNITSNFKNHFKDQYDKFVKNFFEWLYNSKESWAKVFVLKLFIAGMSLTLQIKSYNSKLKRLIFNFNTTMLELVDKLIACVLEENIKTDYALFCISISKAALVAIADTILSNICKMLQKYLNINIKIQEDQIKQLLQYHAALVTQSELQSYHV